MSSLKKWRRGVVLSGLAASVLAGCETETMVVKPGDVSSCMVGDVKCEQSRLYTCETDGRTGSWSFLQRCAKGCAEDLVTCRDEETVVGCRSGDIRCVRDMLQECVSSGGVSSWKTDGACEEGCNSAGTACRVPTSPEPNPGKCTLGAQKCEGSTVYQCRTDASGTAGWRESETCALGCNESETACELSGGGGLCQEGALHCESSSLYQCVWGEGGTAWSFLESCPQGCSEDGVSCREQGVGACILDAQKCEEGEMYRCEVGADGELGYVKGESCPAGCSENGLSCREVVACTDACSAGTECIDAVRYRTCRDDDGDGCLEWVEQSCGGNERCEGTGCVALPTCVDGCVSGSAQCVGKAVQTCRDADGDGCVEWVDGESCEYGCEGGKCRDTWLPPCTTAVCPKAVTNFKETIRGDTSKSKNVISTYTTCSSFGLTSHPDESGPEDYYAVNLPESGTLIAGIKEVGAKDVDVHILTSLSGDGCVARDDYGTAAHVSAGIRYIVVDTYGSSSNAGTYDLKITFLPDSGKCGLKQSTIHRLGGCSAVQLPAAAKVAQEAHLVTDWDRANLLGSAWPTSKTQYISQHVAHTKEITGGYGSGGEWCPSGEGGCSYGQGSTANQVPDIQEAWYINMYWNSASKPARGTKFLVVNPVNGKAVVASGGWETGPGACTHICGTVYEVHQHLGTSHNRVQAIGILDHQDGVGYGPVECE